jgi:uncharacterized surface protein with fasciclin (FAS1) repeats
MKKELAGLTIAIVVSSNAVLVHAADIVDTVKANRSFDIFSTAVETAGFAQTLKNTGPYTVFAPTNEAFAKLSPAVWEQLSQDKVKLARVLSYHVVPGRMTVSEINSGSVKTTQGSTLKLTSDRGKVRVNNANITQSDLAADNGIVHAIDTVILPPP